MTRKNKGHLVKIVKDRLNKDEVIYSSEDIEKAINETLYSIYKAFCDGCSVILEPLGVLKPVGRKSRACLYRQFLGLRRDEGKWKKTTGEMMQWMKEAF